MMSSTNPIFTCESHMPDNLFDVSEKVVIVTGASRGIGRAVAEGFLANGARVVLSARSESLLEQAAGYDADRAIAVRADMADAESGQQITRAAVEAFGRIDVLVNNAAITLPGAPPYDDATWQTTLDVNLSGAFRMARAAADAMVETGGGSIVHVASIAGIVAMPGNPSYSAAKAGQAPVQGYGQRLRRAEHPHQHDLPGLLSYRHDPGQLRRSPASGREILAHDDGPLGPARGTAGALPVPGQRGLELRHRHRPDRRRRLDRQGNVTG